MKAEDRQLKYIVLSAFVQCHPLVVVELLLELLVLELQLPPLALVLLFVDLVRLEDLHGLLEDQLVLGLDRRGSGRQ